jgi:hypothetical protein
MISVTSICNLALQKLGVNDNIIDLSAAVVAKQRAAIECDTAYHPMRRAVLRENRWNFNSTRAILAPSATAPVFGYNYAYPLPADYMRVYECVTSRMPWKVERKSILTDYGSSLQVIYGADIEDPTEFDALFVDLLALRIAIQISPRLSQSKTTKDELIQEYKDLRSIAFQVDSMEGYGEEIEEDDWVLARVSGTQPAFY